MGTFRNQVKANFTAIPNSIARDETLSWKAKGIFLYLASRPDDWDFYMDEILKNATDGKISLQSGVKELLKQGYLIRSRKKDEDHKFVGWAWTLRIPDNHVSHQSGKPTIGGTDDRETASYNNKDYTKKDNTKKEDSIPPPEGAGTSDGMKRTTSPGKSKPSAKERTKKYLPFAKYLSKIVQSQKNIHHTTPQLKTWANDIRKLSELNRVSPTRIKEALQWYRKNAGGKYIPVIESGSSLREKFTKLEDAMKRQNNSTTQNKPVTGYYEPDHHTDDPDYKI